MKMKQFYFASQLVLIKIFLLNGALLGSIISNDSTDEVTLRKLSDVEYLISLINTRQEPENQKTLEISIFGADGFESTENNSTSENIWSFVLVKTSRGQVVRLTKTRTRPSDPATEYSFVWNSAGEGEKVCFTLDNGKRVENLFLSSDGFAIYREPGHPWLVDFQQQKAEQGRTARKSTLCFSTTQSASDLDRNANLDHLDNYLELKFRILVASNIKTVYESAIRNFGYISRPQTLSRDVSGLINPILPVSSFIQNTKLKDPESDIFQLVSELKMRELTNWTILIDEAVKWRSESESFAFNRVTFPNVEKMCNLIRESGHQISLSIDTFLNLDSCQVSVSPTILEGTRCIPDLTLPDSLDWFVEKVHNNLITPYQIESLRFVNEDKQQFIKLFTDFYPYDGIVQKYPESIITLYAKLATRFGAYRSSLNDVANSQAYASIIRFKVSAIDNPIKIMIADSLIFSLAGYQLIQPELTNMRQLTATQYLRWIQAVTFMPVMYIPTVPWQFNDQMVEHVRACINLRKSILVPILADLIQKWIEKGEPIIRPMWYADPNNELFHTIDDQFMVGEDILVAPITDILVPTSREVNFPPGNWTLGLSGSEVFSGRKTFSVAKISDILYFVRM